MKKTAREMFEDLGYEYERKHCYVTYLSRNFEDCYLKFNLKAKDVVIGAIEITIDEHKAMHQQMKELGWL